MANFKELYNHYVSNNSYTYPPSIALFEYSLQLLASGLVALVWLNHEATVVSLRAYSGVLWSCGLLVVLALIGLIGALRHHQVRSSPYGRSN